MADVSNAAPTDRPRPSDPALFLCRSPLQALIAAKIVQKHALSGCDLIFYNLVSSPKNTLYFNGLAAKCDLSTLFYGYSFRGWLSLLPFLRRRYGSIFLADMNHGLFRMILALNRRAQVYTFDDGAGNFDQTTKLHHDRRTWIQRIRDTLLTLPSPSTVRERSVAHYTIDARFPNIVPHDRLRPIELMDKRVGPSAGEASNVVIGQPVHGYPTTEYASLNRAFEAVPNAVYVAHPIQSAADIPAGVSVLDDDRIIEDIVYSIAEAGKRVRLIGGHSTAFVTISGAAIEKYYLSTSTDDPRRANMERVGCTICDVSEGEGQLRWQALVSGWDRPSSPVETS